jgi:hypothetical protein
MRERIAQSIKDAMKSGDKRRLATLRLVMASIKDRDLAAPLDEKGLATGRDSIGDPEILALLQKMIKQRRESIATFAAAGRSDLVEQEEAEIAVIGEFLPQQMTDEEMRAAVSGVMKELACCGLKDMGKVMAVLKERYTGRMDFAKANGAVKDLLK